jgi:hypothetical protein
MKCIVIILALNRIWGHTKDIQKVVPSVSLAELVCEIRCVSASLGQPFPVLSLNTDSKNIILIAIHESKTHRHQLTVNCNNGRK